jgi:hypothetical protein
LAEDMLGDRSALCEWEVWGRTDQSLYLWALCESGTGSGVSTPVVVYLDAVGQVAAVNRPGDGAQYGQDVRRLFPPDIQERIFAHSFDADAALKRIVARRDVR